MSVARVTEITSTSRESFDDAVKNGIERASRTLDNISSAWIQDQEIPGQNEDNVRTARVIPQEHPLSPKRNSLSPKSRRQ